MAYKCVHCNKIYADGAREVLTGCTNEDKGCRSKFFFYIKNEKLKEMEAAIEGDEGDELSTKEKKQIENDVRDLIGEKDKEKPVLLDFESIRIVKPGKYLFDLQKLFAVDKPRVYKLEDGKYVVDLNLNARMPVKR